MSCFTLNNPEGERDISQHPLLPVIKFLLEKCDAATEKFGVANFPMQSIDTEIETLIRQCAGEAGEIVFPDEEIHNLVMLSIQVLRIHLLEIERVDELCLDFSSRYINCLKQKLQSELLSAEFLQEEGVEEVSNTSGDSMFDTSSQNRQVSPEDGHSMQISSANSCAMNTLNNSFGEQSNQFQHCTEKARRRHSLISSLDSLSDNNCRKRGVLPKQATHVMRQWLFQHLMHPYPKESEKQIMASQTGLSLLQVNNWFINARRRVLQPIMDRSNPSQPNTNSASPNSGEPKVKQKKSSQTTSANNKSSANRFWPEELRNASAIQATGSDAGATSTNSSISSIDHHIQHHNQFFSHPALTALLPGFLPGNENHLMSLKDERAWLMAAAAGGEPDSTMAH